MFVSEQSQPRTRAKGPEVTVEVPPRLWMASETFCCEGTVLVTGDSQGGERCVLELVLFSVRVA